MYLFTRSARLGPGSPVEQGAWALGVTEKVNQISELEVSLWATVFSPGLGTLVWTAVVEELSQLEASEAKLLADPSYLSLVEDGAKYSSGQAIDDGLLNLVYPDPDAATIQPQYASVVAGVIAPGHTARAIEFGVEIAQAAKKATGCPTSFGAVVTGPYGGVEWLVMYESVEQMQKAGEALNADASFGELVDKEAATLYLPGVTTQTAFRRIG
jgi:hypothetical protein